MVGRGQTCCSVDAAAAANCYVRVCLCVFKNVDYSRCNKAGQHKPLSLAGAATSIISAFVATIHIFCCDKSMLVVTKPLS